MGKKITIYEDGTTSEIELSDTEEEIIEYAFFDENGEKYYLSQNNKVNADNYLLALQLLYLYRCKTLSKDDLIVYFDLFVKKYFIYIGFYGTYCVMQKHMDKIDYIYEIDESNYNIKKYLIPKFKKISNWKNLSLEDILANFNKENHNLKILGGVVSCYFDLMAEFGKNQPKDESYYKDSEKYHQITITVSGEEIKFFYTDEELLKANYDDDLMNKIHTYYVDNISPYPARERATVKKIICTLFYDSLPKWEVYIEDDEYEEYTVVPIEKKRFNFDKYVDFLNTVSLDTIEEIKQKLFDMHSKIKNNSKVRTKQLEKFLSYIEERKEKEYLSIYGGKIEVLKKYSADLLKSNESCCHFYIGRKIPKKQLQNAITRFNVTIDIDTVIGLYDTTLWNTGKKGYLFTKEAVFYKELIGKTKSFCYEEVENIKIISKDGKKIDELHFKLSNGKTVTMTDTFIDKLAFKQCVEELVKLST